MFFEFELEAFAAAYIPNAEWNLVPQRCCSDHKITHLVSRDFRFRELVRCWIRDVLVLLEGIASWILMNLCCPEGLVVVAWSVDWLLGVDEGVELCQYSVGVEVGHVENSEFGHQRLCVRSGR